LLDRCGPRRRRAAGACSCSGPGPVRGAHSFPTRRSSDLVRLPWLLSLRFESPVKVDKTIALIEKQGLRTALRLGLVIAHYLLARSEEHTSELQSREKLVCRLLLEKNKPRRRRGCGWSSLT